MKENDLLGFLKSGKYRVPILKRVRGRKTPKEISNDLEISISQTSRTLSELLEKELVKCTTPSRKKGRIYKTTEDGENILNTIKGEEI